MALGHPLRAWCLAKLNEGETSGAKLSHLSGEPRNKVNYHLRVLAELGCIELVEERRVRGVFEKIYRAAVKVVLDYGDWERLSFQTRSGISVKALGETLELVEEAFEAETFDRRSDRIAANYKPSLDEEGWREGVEILRELHRRLEELEPESLERTPDPALRSRFTITVMGYESPSSATAQPRPPVQLER